MITNKKAQIGKEQKPIPKLIEKLEEKKQKLKGVNDEVRKEIMKEAQLNKRSLDNKIKTLNENIKLLENNDTLLNSKSLDNSSFGKEIVDENVRKTRIKEVKQRKMLLEKKLNTVEEQIQILINSEKEPNRRSLILKKFQENFENVNKKFLNEIKIYEKSYKEKQERLEEKVLTKEEKRKELEDKFTKKKAQAEADQQEYLEKKKKLAKKQHDKIKEELGNNKLKVISNQMEKYYNDKPDKNDANYLYRIKEEKDKKDIENIEAEKELKYKVGKIIVKSNYKPITREELDEFKQKYESDRQECLLKASRKRATDLEALGELTKIENFPFPETEAKRKVIDEEKENKNNLEKQKLDKIYQAMKIKNFAKVVKENVKPVVDEDKRYEVELRIDRLKNSKNYVSHLHKPKKQKNFVT